MTDFEMLRGRPAHCEESIAEAIDKKLERFAKESDGEEIYEEVLAVDVAKKCGFNKALRHNEPKGKKEMARYAVANAIDSLPVRSTETDWDIDVQETDCYKCKLCNKAVVATKPNGSLVGSFILATHIE